MGRRIAMGFDWQGPLLRENVLERAKVADAVGVDSLWVAEGWGRDAFSLLTQVAERTERVKLGTAIVNIYSRTPGALAQHFATLDELSGGRVIIGLGNSGPNVIEDFHGLAFQPAFRRMRETVEVLRAFFSHEPVNYDGQIFHLRRGFRLSFEPVRKDVPIYLASLNPISVKMTAEIADGWMPMVIPLQNCKQAGTEIRQWVTEAGRDPAAFTVRSPSAVTVANDPTAQERARAAAAGTLAFYCARMGDFYFKQLQRHGYGEEAQAVRDAWSQGGSSAGAAAIAPDMLDEFSFVGNTEQVCERLAQQDDAGIDLHSVDVITEDPNELGKVLEALID